MRANFLASPLVVAYALAGSQRSTWRPIPWATTPTATSLSEGHLADQPEIHDTMRECLTAEMYRARYDNVFEGPQEWQAIDSVGSETYSWQDANLSIPTFFEGMEREPGEISDIVGAGRC